MIVLLRLDNSYEVGNSYNFSRLHGLIEKDDRETALYNIYPHNVIYTDNRGRTPLHCSCLKGVSFKRVSRRLIRYGSNINKRDLYCKTPLHYACESNDLFTVIELLAYNANPNSLDIHGKPPAAYVDFTRTSFQIIKKLIQHGSKWKFNINIASYQNHALYLYEHDRLYLDFSTNSTLLRAIRSDFTQLSIELIESNKFDMGDYMIKEAIENFNITIVETLLKVGCATSKNVLNYCYECIDWYPGEESYSTQDVFLIKDMVSIFIVLLEHGAVVDIKAEYYNFKFIDLVFKEIRQRRWDKRKPYIFLRERSDKFILNNSIDLNLIQIGEHGIFRKILMFL